VFFVDPTQSKPAIPIEPINPNSSMLNALQAFPEQFFQTPLYQNTISFDENRVVLRVTAFAEREL
jgi:hypothetical protein